MPQKKKKQFKDIDEYAKWVHDHKYEPGYTEEEQIQAMLFGGEACRTIERIYEVMEEEGYDLHDLLSSGKYYRLANGITNHGWCYEREADECPGHGAIVYPIEEARMKAGYTRKGMSVFLGIPIRTIENWDRGKRPVKWVEELVIYRLEKLPEERAKLGNIGWS